MSIELIAGIGILRKQYQDSTNKEETFERIWNEWYWEGNAITKEILLKNLSLVK